MATAPRGLSEWSLSFLSQRGNKNSQRLRSPAAATSLPLPPKASGGRFRAGSGGLLARNPVGFLPCPTSRSLPRLRKVSVPSGSWGCWDVSEHNPMCESFVPAAGDLPDRTSPLTLPENLAANVPFPTPPLQPPQPLLTILLGTKHTLQELPADSLVFG